MARVVLAMSGGVDSSVAAALLREAGHEVIGVFMRHGGAAETCAVAPETPLHSALPALPLLEPRGHKQGCCSAADAADGRRVAERLGIPFYALDLQEEFEQIIDYFTEEYTAGRTPNPCVVCNNWLKFGRLFEYADRLGAEYVATGHYARIAQPAEHGRFGILRGVDRSKDQSYVLFGVDRDRLARMLLPVGGFSKGEIRRRAGELGLRVADKPDSQEICFVAAGKHAEFVRDRTGASTAGEIVTIDGRVVGRHAGIEGFTVGQRKGLGVALGEPHFVVRIEPESRRVVIGPRESLRCRGLTAERLHWHIPPAASEFTCSAQVRYNSSAAEGVARLTPEGRLELEFQSPREGIAPGQAVVLYRGDLVLGGGWITAGVPAVES